MIAWVALPGGPSTSALGIKVKTSFRVALIVGFSSLVGLIIGCLGVGWFMGGMLDQSVLSSAEAQLTQDSIQLEKLSHGDLSGSTRVLQEKIDINLVEVSYFLTHDYKLAEGMPQTLERIRSVRASMGYVPANSAVRERADSVLSNRAETR